VKKLINQEFAVLDIDGTILDSKKMCRKIVKIISFNQFLYHLYLKSFEKTFVSQTICNISNFLEKKPKKFIGTQKFLKTLKENNMKIFGSTRSNIKNIKRILKEEKILNFFHAIKGNEMSKINHIPYFAELLKINLEEFCQKAIYIGDEPADAYIAKKMNILPIIITNTYTKKELEKIQEREVLIVKELKEAIK
jgi:phosphoglycolate phosphatase-like HAD superfamily hydrolase